MLGSYPITPASDVLHELSKYKHFGVTTIQAEDEIAAVATAIGASYAGAIGCTTTSGPGLALKTEAIGLAVATELPLVVVDVQRGGPSTGLPTKTEQADLLQAVYGRNSEAPLCVVAAATPGDCFHMALEATRLALEFMTPVILLTDGYLANGAEPWRIPDVSSLPKINVKFRTDPEGFKPFERNPDTLARNWAIPGTPGLEHRIGGLEKDYETGNISYDPDNHDKMCRTRAAKIAGIANHIPEQQMDVGPDSGKLLVLGWGSTYGAIRSAVERCRARGLEVSHAHVRYINPLPRNLGELMSRFDRVLIPELNLGQLSKLIRSRVPRAGGELREVRRPAVPHRRSRGTHPPDDGELKTMNDVIETPKLTRKDFATDQDVRWCPGCGDYSILANVQRVMPELGVARENIVWVSGIGCSSRFPYYMNTFGFHTIHGRAPAIAMGVKAANPELSVWVVTGDGDGLSIGGNHLLHALRRNLDIHILMFNNRIYGLTKGQYSPTSEFGKVTKSTPLGSADQPVDPATFALGSGGSFVARSIDVDAQHLSEMLRRAAQHKGTTFLEIYQNCNVFNDGAFDSFRDKAAQADRQLRVEHGKPLVFGKDKNQGLRISARTLSLEVVTDRRGRRQGGGHPAPRRDQRHAGIHAGADALSAVPGGGRRAVCGGPAKLRRDAPAPARDGHRQVRQGQHRQAPAQRQHLAGVAPSYLETKGPESPDRRALEVPASS